ncbi:hypothetical protein MKQ68_18090 [Chitinophaga horti]|uniref:Outer membrane protein beta-barrel domain-containing protein n=1 Tax=Chitinophaga horti TaxID=2920382 RepID=A0ABY6IX88_9BACT|nr:hypothetical protein [Chitinophaga horti]UYQ91999.1 hypothetical protein MKQ68_18090 [Chitinophaga horti]
MKLSTLLCLAATAGLFSSCTRTMHTYVPSAVNAPLLKEQHDVRALVSLNAAQIAYAPTDHLGIMVNGQFIYNRDWYFGNDDDFYDTTGDEDVVDRDLRGGTIEFGAGYFTTFDEKKRAIFEVYAGVGTGKFRTLDDDYYNHGDTVSKRDFSVSNRLTKFFVQPSIGFSHKVIDIAFTPRFTVTRFHSQTLGPRAFESDAARMAEFRSLNNTWVPFIEPTFTFRVGYKYVKYQMQLTLSQALRDDYYNDAQITNYFQRAAFNVGASFNFGKWLNESRQ